MSYCDAVKLMDVNSVHRVYHDTAYGYPISDDDELFERLVLEINQAGLSWTTILNKQPHFKKAYSNFNIKKVAGYGEEDRLRLLSDARIIRNRLKVDAAIHNAGVIMQLQQEFGSFANWIQHHHPKSKEEWVKLFKKTFKFTGGEIVNEFLMSIGYLPNAHQPDCPVYALIKRQKPAWDSFSQLG